MSLAAAICAIALCFQPIAHAEERKADHTEERKAESAAGSTPYAFFVFGNVVDTVGTIYGKNRGNVELDPALNGSTGRIIAVKAISTLAFAAVMKLFDDHGHPTVAKILGYVGGSVTLGAGINDIRIAK